MRVLFVCSGNSKHFEVAPFISSQGNSLIEKGIYLDYFTIKGKGLKGYIKSIPRLKSFLKENKYDLLHAHYSLSGWVTLFGGLGIPKVLSLMGSDSHGGSIKKSSLSFMRFQLWLIQFFYKTIIVKSENIKNSLWAKRKVLTIPNGVNFDQFRPLDKKEARNKLNLDMDKKYILFMANPEDDNKNFQLLSNAMYHLNEKEIEILKPFPVVHENVYFYYNACDVLVFPSKKEGSPNVIKEALACNAKIVATLSGDIKEQTKDLANVYISKFDAKDLAEGIEKMIGSTVSVNSREIVRNRLDDQVIAEQLISVYQSLKK